MIHTYEGIYENGVIRFADDVRLPEHTKVYVMVPEVVERTGFRIGSPHLAHPLQAVDFVKEVVEEGFDASIR